VSNNSKNNNHNSYVFNKNNNRSISWLLHNIRTTYISVNCNYHQSLRLHCFSQPVTSVHIFPPFFSRKISLSHLFLLSQLTILFFYMYSVYTYLFCCFETLFISIFLTPVPYSASCTTSVHIFFPKCQRHLTLNGRTCRLTMYFSLFLFCHAVFGCLVFRFSVHHLLEISRSTISVWRGWLRHCATSRMVAGSIPRWFQWKF